LEHFIGLGSIILRVQEKEDRGYGDIVELDGAGLSTIVSVCVKRSLRSTRSIRQKPWMQPVLYSTGRRTHQLGIKDLADVFHVVDQFAVVTSTSPRK
jgi:hypothetical protein